MKLKHVVKVLLILILALFALLVDLPKEQLASVGLDDSWFGKSKFQLGLDLQGGTQLRYRIDLSSVPEPDRNQIVEGIRTVIEKRVNNLGVSEAVIQTSMLGALHYIIVELPGVKDIQQAVKAVGKTVQLEFKEQKAEYSPAELEEIKKFNTDQEKLANDILARVKGGEDFTALAREYSQAGNITGGGESDFQTKGEMNATLAEKAFALKDGEIAPEVIQTEQQFVILKTLEHGTKAKQTTNDAKAKAAHILISYQGSSLGEEAITRTKEEAQKLAEEALARVKGGEDFATVAKELTEDAGTKESGGDLGEFGKGKMVPEFEKAVFEAKPGDVVGPIETQYGFHVIKVESITQPETKEESEPTVKTAQIAFTREPEKPLDGWVKTKLTGKQFTHAAVQLDPNTYSYVIAIQFNEEGKQLFADLTKANLNKPIAIFLDNQLISAPTVQSEIADGQAIITGRFSAQSAAELARDLNTGAIPAPVILIGQTTIGATLGSDALANGIRAGLIGLICLALFMILYYRLPGLVANMALIVYALVVLMIFKIWPVTLTLAGIAGFILSLGMAVDANVLIFERLKEELRAGKTLSLSMDEGFNRAWNAIRDSNVSSLITCAILWIFGTSIIRGFAVTLSIGILVSMFTAIVVTRTFLHFFINQHLRDKHWLWGARTYTKDHTTTHPTT